MVLCFFIEVLADNKSTDGRRKIFRLSDWVSPFDIPTKNPCSTVNDVKKHFSNSIRNAYMPAYN